MVEYAFDFLAIFGHFLKENAISKANPENQGFLIKIVNI